MTNNLTKLSESEQNAIIVKELARKGFPEYCIATDKSYKLEWFHRKIALKLEEAYRKVKNGEDVRLMIFMPPRHGKSEMATKKFPSWVLGDSPDYPIIVSSYSQELATAFGQATRDIMNSSIYQSIFNTTLREDTKAKSNWMTEQGGGYLAVGIGGSITGKGFNIGIIDDPFKNREEADSPTIRESRYKWYQSTFSTREEGNSAIILIVTRWHDDDLAGRLLADQKEAEKNGEEDYDKWEVITYKAIADEDDENRKKGDALWPTKFPIEKLNKKKSTMGTYEFSSLYQQNPVDEDNQEFRRDWIKYRTREEVSEMTTRKFATIDTALSKHATSDLTGVTRNYVDLADNWNISARQYRINPTELIELVFTLHGEGFEEIGIEQGIYLDVLEPFMKKEMQQRSKYPRVVPLQHGGVQKETRIRALIPRYEHGKVFHIKGECDDLEKEMFRFPSAPHDDVIDSEAYQLHIAKKPNITEEDFNLYAHSYR